MSPSDLAPTIQYGGPFISVESFTRRTRQKKVQEHFEIASLLAFTLRGPVEHVQLCHFPTCLCNSRDSPGRSSQSEPDGTLFREFPLTSKE